MTENDVGGAEKPDTAPPIIKQQAVGVEAGGPRAERDRRYHPADRRKVINGWKYFISHNLRSGVKRRSGVDRRG